MSDPLCHATSTVPINARVFLSRLHRRSNLGQHAEMKYGNARSSRHPRIITTTTRIRPVKPTSPMYIIKSARCARLAMLPIERTPAGIVGLRKLSKCPSTDKRRH
ncbi:hypothetical protein Zmor_009680 [Zophobas morio]|uniref:Uncharacterized protein n=1 Tax=Zophobas morio TaxID=2755281 RepID=A0AA38IMS9_9CUCU|nr:hypothetical protein Zmor_009680 [Zophobas morio]